MLSIVITGGDYDASDWLLLQFERFLNGQGARTFFPMGAPKKGETSRSIASLESVGANHRLSGMRVSLAYGGNGFSASRVNDDLAPHLKAEALAELRKEALTLAINQSDETPSNLERALHYYNFILKLTPAPDRNAETAA
jgi:hypothetical protein